MSVLLISPGPVEHKWSIELSVELKNLSHMFSNIKKEEYNVVAPYLYTFYKYCMHYICLYKGQKACVAFDNVTKPVFCFFKDTVFTVAAAQMELVVHKDAQI